MAGMDERAALEGLLPVLLRTRCPTSATVLLVEFDEDSRLCFRKKSME